MRQWIRRSLILCLACLVLAGSTAAVETARPEVSRGAFVDALYDAHVAHGGAPVVSSVSTPFRDVGSWSPYYEALCWAKASGIAGGYGGGAFRPAEPVSRQQAAVMLYRYAQATDLPADEDSPTLAGYQDADAVPDWSRDAVEWAVGNGLWFSGSVQMLRPAEPVTAEELEALVSRLFTGGAPAETFQQGTTAQLVLEVDRCSTTEATVRLRNDTEETFSYSADFGLYQQVNGGWYQLNRELSVDAKLERLEPGSSREIDLRWGNLEGAGVLPPGTYRISLSGMLGDQAAEVFVDFIIK